MNLYVHFPFCRRKCSYCVLYSRVGVSQADREEYVKTVRARLEELDGREKLDTVYFGGGSPALCDLRPLATVRDRLSPDAEFTVELHPLDATEDKLRELKDIGVNRISMGVQSLDDDVLRHMLRGYTADEAERAFATVKCHFDNAGIDLIVGYPGERQCGIGRLRGWGLRHCSVYALQNERRLADVPDDETAMNLVAEAGSFLKSIGLERYEISNYARRGYECRHNLAVWRGEDYVGIGDGAFGRIGLTRTMNAGGRNPKTETVTPERDETERKIFRLRTREGIDATGHREWLPALDGFAAEGLLSRTGSIYRLTPRGTEVCDTILAALV